MNETREIGSELCGRSENRLRLSKVQAALDWVPCQLASASPREKSAPQWQENVRHNKKASVGIYGNLGESMGSLEKTSQCYGNPLLRTTEIPISVTAYH